MIGKPSLFNMEYFLPLCISYLFYTQILASTSPNLSTVDTSICSNNSMCNLKFALKKCNHSDVWSIH